MSSPTMNESLVERFAATVKTVEYPDLQLPASPENLAILMAAEEISTAIHQLRQLLERKLES